jgi:hypothetical protein
LAFTGPSGGRAFVTTCEEGTITAKFTPRDGNPATAVTGPVTNMGCPPPSGKPTASGSLTGLASGKPTLRLSATHGSNAPDIASLSIGLPAGLSFNHKALVAHRVCKGARRHRRCTTSLSVKGLSLSGTGVKSARIQGGELLITLTRNAAGMSLAARGPLLAESKGLARKAKHHKSGTLVARVGITDATGKLTVVSVP